jgi:DNA polymerase I-like protein with 3'-5' exonuclease and polymerase domains
MKLKIRSMIAAPKGRMFIMCDLSQAESWVVAHLANDPNMMQSLKYSDIHADTAEVLFADELSSISISERDWKQSPLLEMRYIGKRNNHANSYGMGPERNAQVINKDSDQPPHVTVTVAQCKIYQARWHAHYFNVKGKFWADVQLQLGKNRTLTTPYGRPRTFFGEWGNELFKEGYAFIPQSSVADHFNGVVHPQLGIEGGLLQVYKRLVKPSNGDILLINQSHDSLMLEVPIPVYQEVALETMSLLKRPMIVNDMEFTIPVDCEVGDRWGEMEKLKVA